MTRRKHLALVDLSGRDIGGVVEIEGTKYRVLSVQHSGRPKSRGTRIVGIWRDGTTAVWTDPQWPSRTRMRRVRGVEPIDGLPLDFAEFQRLGRVKAADPRE